jgi:hypothetical protein
VPFCTVAYDGQQEVAMFQRCVALLIVLLIASLCSAESITQRTLPELIDFSDVIVTGEVIAVNRQNATIRIIDTFVGEIGGELRFSWGFSDSNLIVGRKRLYFLHNYKDGLTTVYPSVDVSKIDELRRLLDMQADPAKYVTDPKHNASLDFIAILGSTFASRVDVGALSKHDAIMHVSKFLTSKDSLQVVQAVSSLSWMGCKDVKPILPLLEHTEEYVRLAAVGFIVAAPDKQATKALCQMLDNVKDTNSFPYRLDEALLALDDKASVPALEHAAQRKIEGSMWVLGALGNTQSFHLLMELVVKEGFRPAHVALFFMVHRSNKKIEPWMIDSESPTAKADWRKWWQANKADFSITKTFREALPRYPYQ